MDCHEERHCLVIDYYFHTESLSFTNHVAGFVVKQLHQRSFLIHDRGQWRELAYTFIRCIVHNTVRVFGRQWIFNYGASCNAMGTHDLVITKKQLGTRVIVLADNPTIAAIKGKEFKTVPNGPSIAIRGRAAKILPCSFKANKLCCRHLSKFSNKL